jgi:hypothetical protein
MILIHPGFLWVARTRLPLSPGPSPARGEGEVAPSPLRGEGWGEGELTIPDASKPSMEKPEGPEKSVSATRRIIGTSRR